MPKDRIPSKRRPGNKIRYSADKIYVSRAKLSYTKKDIFTTWFILKTYYIFTKWIEYKKNPISVLLTVLLWTLYIIFSVTYNSDFGLIRVVDAESISGSDTEDDYNEEISFREPPLSPGVIEKIYNSKGVKVQENIYDLVVKDGIQKKQISRSLFYSKMNRDMIEKSVSYDSSGKTVATYYYDTMHK